MKAIVQIIISIAILAAGFFSWHHFGKQDEVAQSNASPNRPDHRKMQMARAQQTRVMELKAVDYPVVLETQGIIATPVLTTLTPQVSGRITSISPLFENGAFFKKGDVLIELDPADYALAIISAEASLARAESALAQEQARAAQARRNWEDIGFTDQPNDLVLRKPQLKEAEANVLAQQAVLERAQRDLERTKIHAPFDGRVRNRSVGLGQAVGNGTKLGEIFSTAFAEFRLPLSSRQLKYIDLSTIGQHPVKLQDAINPAPDKHWQARIVRTEGELDPSSRELFLIARIDDPFNLAQKPNTAPLRINQPVSAILRGQTIPNVIEVPRSAISGENEIVLVENGKVKRVKLNVVWSTLNSVIADNSSLDGSQLALSKLTYSPEGSPLRIITDEPEAEGEAKTDDKPQSGTNRNATTSQS